MIIVLIGKFSVLVKCPFILPFLVALGQIFLLYTIQNFQFWLYFCSRSRSRGARNGGVDPSAWRSYEPEPLSSDQDSPAIPKFQPDPEIPLENMVALGDHHGGSDHSESEDGVDEGHGSSPQKWRCVSTVDIGPEGNTIQ